MKSVRRMAGGIAIICGAGIVSGKEIMALELGQGLREKGKHVIYVTSLWGNGDFNCRLSSLDFPFHGMRLGFISATLTLECVWMTADQLIRWPKLLYDYGLFLRREQPRHVIHTNWHHVLMLWPFLKPERDMLWLHEVVPFKPRYSYVFNRIADHVLCFVAVSEAVADALRQLGIRNEKICMIHNGILDPAFGQTDKLGQKQIHIGIVGQVGAWKGHEDLLEAFSQIVADHPLAVLQIYGSKDQGDFTEHLHRRAEALSLSSRLVWNGFVPERVNVYASMDICVVPSRTADPLPTTAIEAAYFKIPVIATRKGGLPEIVIDGETGYLVDAYSPAQLADRMARLLEDPELRRRMGAAARERATQYFSRERFTHDFLRLLSRKQHP